MKHTKKILALALSAAVVASIAAAGTLAYLTSQDNVVNNFQVGTKGKVEIVLDEAVVNENGKAPDATDRTDSNDYVSMLPGQIMDKDPTVHVQADSAASYVYVAVNNALGDDATLNIDLQNWAMASTYRDMTIYQYVGTKATNKVVPATDAVLDLEPVFTTVTINKDLDAEGLAKLDGKQITVFAYAIQAENLENEGISAEAVAGREAIAYFTPIADTMFAGDFEEPAPIEPEL